jgi:hypothetical protein
MTQNNEFEPLFTSADDWQCNARLNWSDDPLELYAIGYKEAADILVKQVMETAFHQDALVYPICFLYRQYIELRLKEIIQSGRKLLDEKGSFPKHHKIQTLFATVKEVIKGVFQNEKEPNLSLPEHVISEFSKLDPDSSSFRYPTDKSGMSLISAISHINMRHLYEYIGKFAEDMDAISFSISVYHDRKREIQSCY